jgi:hypothetical protein
MIVAAVEKVADLDILRNASILICEHGDKVDLTAPGAETFYDRKGSKSDQPDPASERPESAIKRSRSPGKATFPSQCQELGGKRTSPPTTLRVRV